MFRETVCVPSLSISQALRKKKNEIWGAVSRARELTCSDADDAVIASFFQPRNAGMERNGEEKMDPHCGTLGTAQRWPSELRVVARF